MVDVVACGSARLTEQSNSNVNPAMLAALAEKERKRPRRKVVSWTRLSSRSSEKERERKPEALEASCGGLVGAEMAPAEYDRKMDRTRSCAMLIVSTRVSRGSTTLKPKRGKPTDMRRVSLCGASSYTNAVVKERKTDVEGWRKAERVVGQAPDGL